MKWLYSTLFIVLFTSFAFAQKVEDIPEKGRVIHWNASVKTDSSNILPGNPHPFVIMYGPNGHSALWHIDQFGEFTKVAVKRKSSVDTFYVQPGSTVEVKLSFTNEWTSNYYFDRPIIFNQGTCNPISENPSFSSNSHGGENARYYGEFTIEETTEIQFYEYSMSGQLPNALAPYRIVFLTENPVKPLPDVPSRKGKGFELSAGTIVFQAETDELTQLTIYNVEGKVQLEEAFTNRTIVGGLELSKGMYFFVLTNQQGSKTFKVHLN